MDGQDSLTIRDLIWAGNQDPDRNAIESPGYAPLTYRALRVQMLAVVQDLNARGFRRNDRIAIIAPPGPDTAVAIVSVMAGFTSVPLNPHGRDREFAALFLRIGINAVLVPAGCETAATAVAEEAGIPVITMVPESGTAGIFSLEPQAASVNPTAEFARESDTAYILLTSGTTADAKIIPVTQRRSAVFKLRLCRAQNLSGADRCLHIVPYFHGMGISGPLLCPLLAGATVICVKDFIPPDFLPLLSTFRPTFYVAGPPLQRSIIRELKKVPPGSLKNHSLRFIRSGSGFLPEDVATGLETLLGVPVIDAYSLSEAGTVAVNIPSRKNSVGIPLVSGLRIADESGNASGPGHIGEILLQDEVVFDGYENAPEETATVFAGGWLKTGDLGYLDDDGYLFLTGRIKDVINKGGEKIAPAEIDSVLLSHPDVKDAMTFPIDDPVLGEDIAAPRGAGAAETCLQRSSAGSFLTA